MIVIITAPGHEYTCKAYVDDSFGFPIPSIRAMNYGQLLHARQVPRATYIFGDIERLSAWELRLAADLHAAMTAQGLRCLNNPAFAMSRVELIAALHAAKLIPYRAFRADERPRPTRFPVFVRSEADHLMPIPELIGSQKQLDEMLRTLQARHVPLRGTLVVEVCSRPYSPGLWHKWGTFRIGDQLSVDHIAVDGTWLVKYGDWNKLTDDAVKDEHDAVLSNRFAGELQRVFDLAHIEYGRADHATIASRSVVYEINTNPSVGPYVPDPKPLRMETQKQARLRLAASFAAIDTAQSGTVELGTTDLLGKIQALPALFMTPRP